MAEIKTNGKSAPSVDMTPMVDLGFLLITFFMLASSFLSPKVIKMLSPADESDPSKLPSLKCSKSLTLILDETNMAKYYVCPESSQADSVDFSSTGLRKLILQRQNEVKTQFGDKNDLLILVKSTPQSKYKQLVDAIDEMHITASNFMIAKIDQQDSVVFKL